MNLLITKSQQILAHHIQPLLRLPVRQFLDGEFAYNAYILLTGEVDTRDNPWAQNLIENWDREQYGLETIYGYSIRDGFHDKGDGQYLVYMLMPVFDAEKYRKEVELESHEFSPASDPSILVYADEIEFEALLASVNKRKKPRK